MPAIVATQLFQARIDIVQARFHVSWFEVIVFGQSGHCECLKKFEYDIDVIDNPSFKIFPARWVPYAIRDRVKSELDKMVKFGVITPVSDPRGEPDASRPER